MKFGDPGTGSVDFIALLSLPPQYVCARCLRVDIDADCLSRTCTPAHQDRPLVGQAFMRGNADGSIERLDPKLFGVLTSEIENDQAPAHQDSARPMSGEPPT